MKIPYDYLFSVIVDLAYSHVFTADFVEGLPYNLFFAVICLTNIQPVYPMELHVW